MSKEKDVYTLHQAYEDLKESANGFGAASAKVTTEDDEWVYTIEVKRKNRRRNGRNS